MLKIKKRITIFHIFVLIISQKALAKNYDLQTFICADEIGPKLEFNIPSLDDNKPEKKFSFKVYESKNRKSYNIIDGVIKKLSSPIDNSYSYYKGNSNQKLDEYYKVNFEFYPPSHLLIQTLNSQFSDLVCWNK